MLSIDADERATPALAAEVRQRDIGSGQSMPRIPCADSKRDPGPAFRVFGDAERFAAAIISPRLPGAGLGWCMRRSSLTGLSGSSKTPWGITRCRMCEVFLDKLDHYTTLEAKTMAALAGAVQGQRRHAAAVVDVLETICVQAGLS